MSKEVREFDFRGETEESLADMVRVLTIERRMLNKEYAALQEENKRLREALEKAVAYLEEGKRKFTPHTTNSFVDDFIKQHKALKEREG